MPRTENRKGNRNKSDNSWVDKPEQEEKVEVEKTDNNNSWRLCLFFFFLSFVRLQFADGREPCMS